MSGIKNKETEELFIEVMTTNNIFDTRLVLRLLWQCSKTLIIVIFA